MLSAQIARMAANIASYLDGILSEHGKFPARSFYAEAFAAWLFHLNDGRYHNSIAQLVELYRAKDKAAEEYHWEFNQYAWMSIYRLNGDNAAREFAFPLRFKGTTATNWVLLRCCTSVLAESNVGAAVHEANALLRSRQGRNGLIWDESGVRSFQYHCFSAVLAAEIANASGDVSLWHRFERAAHFISQFVLTTGDTLYVGRGQQQSFGYGALAYLLALAYHRSGEARFLELLRRCLDFLAHYERADGSFPLVMNEEEKSFPTVVNPSDSRYPGWYAYNNYFDYLPFLGVMLMKARHTLIRAGAAAERDPVNASDLSEYRDNLFWVVRRKHYEAVVAAPGGNLRGEGYWSNDLPMPYVVCRRHRLTPSYGGEQFGSALYGARGIPLPIVEVKHKEHPFRAGRVWATLVAGRLIVVSKWGVFTRSFRFDPQEIVITDRLISAARGYCYYLFETVESMDSRGQLFAIGHGGFIRSDVPLQLDPTPQHFWGGALQGLRSRVSCRRNTLCLFPRDLR